MTESAKRVPMIATARQCYDGRWLHSGEPFEVKTDAEADDLVAMRFAERVNRPPTVVLEKAISNPSGEAQEDVLTDQRTDAGTLSATTDEQTNRADTNAPNNKRNEYSHRSMRARK